MAVSRIKYLGIDQREVHCAHPTSAGIGAVQILVITVWNFTVRRAASLLALLIPDELSLEANISLEFLRP